VTTYRSHLQGKFGVQMSRADSVIIRTILTSFNINKNPTRYTNMQIFIYCKVTLHVSGVTAPIIRSTKNCNCSLRYRSYYWYSYFPPMWPITAKSLYMFRVSQHPSSGVLKTVTAASGTGRDCSSDQATLDGSGCTDIMTCTGGCSYSF